MQSNDCAYVNGRFVLESEATVSIFDRGFLYGDGVFETMRVYGGTIFRLYQHLLRLFNGLRVLQIEPDLTQEDLHAVLLALIQRNGLKDGMARVYVTRGPIGLGVRGQAIWQPTVVAVVKQKPTSPTELRAIISTIRLDAGSKLAGIKSANRLPHEMAHHEAINAGFSNAVLLNGTGRVVEFATSNLFVVKNGELFTPPLTDGPLPGITRDVVLTLASKLDMATYEIGFGTEMFSEVDEVFATNSVREIEPVQEVDGAKFQEHHVTMRLQQAYRDLVAEEIQSS
jgi:branched-chain amino acid aminotransferase